MLQIAKVRSKSVKGFSPINTVAFGVD